MTVISSRFGGMLLLVLISLPSTPASAANHFCFGKPATIVGTSNNDRIQGTAKRDVIVGLGGIDHVLGRKGNDLICLGPGGRSETNTEVAYGNSGDDRISGAGGFDAMWSGDGADHLRGGSEPDALFGDKGADSLRGGESWDYLFGGNGSDILRGGVGSDTLDAGRANDRLIGGGNGPEGDMASYFEARTGVEVNLLQGYAKGEGRDKLVGIENVWGSRHNDKLLGDYQDNLLKGTSGSDVLRAKGGDDCLSGGGDINRLYGGQGIDIYGASLDCYLSQSTGGSIANGATVDLAEGTASGRFETTTLSGIEGVVGTYDNDHIMGDGGPNFLYGNPGNDIIEGRGGDDELNGAGGTDTVDGGDGNDDCRDGEVLMGCE